MPLSTIASKAVDQVSNDRAAVLAHVLNYAGTDLLCYRAGHPPELQSRQHETWQPLLDWAADTFNARLVVTEGVTPVDQPKEALSGIKDIVEALDDRTLAGLAVLTQATGSLIIGLALLNGRLDAGAAMQASQLDERWQKEKWGEDGEDRKQLDALKNEIQETLDFLDLVQSREGS